MKLRYLLFAGVVLLAAGCKPSFQGPDAEDLDYRIRVDFCKTRDDMREYIQKFIPDVTEEQIDEWTANGKLESMEIDGQRMYFRRAHTNLFLIDSNCIAVKKALIDPSEYIGGVLASDVASVNSIRSYIAESEKTGKNFVNPRYARMRHTITVDADAVPAGETVRCWVPFPRRDVRRQKVELLATSEKKFRVSDIKAPHSCVYMEKKAVAGEPTVFWIEYNFDTTAEYFDLSGAKAAAYDKSSDLYKRYTCEQPPHIVFDERMVALSDSLTKGIKNPVDKVKAIFSWISTTFPWAGSREYGTMANIPAYVLDNGHGDCGMKTLLLMTLSRIAGIPCHWESGLIDDDDCDWNMHDWCRMYFEGIGWVTVDQSYGLYKYRDVYPELTWINVGSVDHDRIVFNSEWGKPLQPAKKFARSEPVDFQKGEVEWRGGNVYFDKWHMSYEVQYINK